MFKLGSQLRYPIFQLFPDRRGDVLGLDRPIFGEEILSRSRAEVGWWLNGKGLRTILDLQDVFQASFDLFRDRVLIFAINDHDYLVSRGAGRGSRGAKSSRQGVGSSIDRRNSFPSNSSLSSKKVEPSELSFKNPKGFWLRCH
jgi:hypothetical protein